jgi:hypothetical protein
VSSLVIVSSIWMKEVLGVALCAFVPKDMALGVESEMGERSSQFGVWGIEIR